MNNYLNQAHNTALCNIARLSIEPCTYETETIKTVEKVGKRFIQSVTMLPKGTFLGWQLSADEEGQWNSCVFSSEERIITADDYNWIFEGCATVCPEPLCVSEEFWNDHRKLYLLNLLTNMQDQNSGDSRPNAEVFQDLMEMLNKEGAVIRIIASPDMENQSATSGMILVSLPKGISLRLRANISMTYPDLELKELSSITEVDNSFGLLPGKTIQANMTRFLYCLTYRPCDDRYQNDWDEWVCDDEPEESVPQILTETEEEPVISVKPSYMDMLNELIGIEAAKEQVKKIAAYARMKQEMELQDKEFSMALNMQFIGNPGTGKTTVARILAGIFYETGLITSDEVVEVGRSGLVARYEGQTADKVRSVFEKAKGKLLFIDEAYSLVENWDGEFGDEAINTIVQEMENNREDTVVIFAGYTDKMEGFISRNPGLRSRVPFTIKFQDYSAEELVQIVNLEVVKRGFEIAAEAKEKISSVCASAVGKAELGNGRFCRNLVESAILNYAARVYGEGKEESTKDFVLKEEDFSIPEELKKAKDSVPLGFHI